MTFNLEEYPINVLDSRGDCIYTEYLDGTFVRRWFHADPNKIPKVMKIQFGKKERP